MAPQKSPPKSPKRSSTKPAKAPKVLGPSGYVVHLWVDPGGARRDCTFAYGTYAQLQFVLRQEYQPRDRARLDVPIWMGNQYAELSVVDDGDEVAQLDLREFITLHVWGKHARLDDEEALGALYGHADKPVDSPRGKARFEIDWEQLEAELPVLEGPPAQPGDYVAGALYGYASSESWVFPHEREPPPPRRILSKQGWASWGSQPNDRFPSLGPLRGVLRPRELSRGASRRPGFPGNTRFDVLDNYDQRPCSDNPIAAGHAVISKRLRDALKPLLGKSKVEFLPVKLKEKSGRRAEGTYFVLNPLDVLKPDEVTDDVVIYRPKAQREQIRLRADVAWALESGDFTQLDFGPVDPAAL